MCFGAELVVEQNLFHNYRFEAKIWGFEIVHWSVYIVSFRILDVDEVGSIICFVVLDINVDDFHVENWDVVDVIMRDRLAY